MTTEMVSTVGMSDAGLVSQSLAGNRDAFERIVSRYQCLICSLAYGATGSLGQSEDLAKVVPAQTEKGGYGHILLLPSPLPLVLFAEEREQSTQLRLVRPSTVFADFKRFGVSDLRSPVLAI